MSFKKQAKEYSCGAASLRYALMFLGRSVEEKDLRKASRTHFGRGADEAGLVKAAGRYGCEAIVRNHRSFAVAFRIMLKYVQGGQPCILCVDQWKHWVTVTGANRSAVAFFDPKARDVASVIKPRSLRRRWRWQDSRGEDDKPYYFFIAIRPKKKRRFLPSQGLGDRKLIEDLRRREDLREGWDGYLQDLVDVFGRKKSRAEDSYPAWKFIQRHSGLLVEMVSYWDGHVPQYYYKTELRNLTLVCRAYGLVVRPRDEESALVSLTCILTHGGVQN